MTEPLEKPSSILTWRSMEQLAQSPMKSWKKSRQEIAIQALQWRSLNEKFRFYKPNEPCRKYLELIGSEADMVNILSTSNGLGKTALVANLLANVIWGPQSKAFDYPIFKDWKFPKRVRYITNPKLTEAIGPFHSEVARWWPKGQWRAEKAGKGYFSQYHANGWIIDVMSYDQDVQQFEGGTLGLIICDEPPVESIYNACISRLRLGGLLLVVMTPLTHAAWFFNKVVPEHQNSIIYGRMEDACKEHGVNGHLEHSFIEKMINEMPVEEREARVEGKAMHLRGLIFQTFDTKVHVLKEPVVCPPHLSCYQIVDPHDDKPFAVTYAFPDAVGDLYIHDEWPNEDFYKMHNCQLTVDDYVKIFKDKEQRWHMYKRIMDRRFGEVSHAGNRRTLREEFLSKGFNYDQSYSAQEEMETGILRVRKYLAYDVSKPISSLNHPKIYINPKCVNTIKSLSLWSRDPNNGKVQEAYKDFCDNLRYLVMADPKVEEDIPRNQPNRYG